MKNAVGPRSDGAFPFVALLALKLLYCCCFKYLRIGFIADGLDDNKS